VLAACEQQLVTVTPQLAGYEASYYRNLLDMTALVLESADIAERDVTDAPMPRRARWG